MDLSQNEEIQQEEKDVEKLETVQTLSKGSPKVRKSSFSEQESEEPATNTNSKAKKRAKKPRTKKQVEAFQKMIKKRKENLEARKNGSTKEEKVDEKPREKPQEKPQEKPKAKPQEKPQPKQEIPKAKPQDESDTESDSESDTDTESDDKPPPKKHAAKMKVFTHDNVRRQVNRPNLCNREYKSGYSRETIEQAKQELKRNRTNKSKMTQRNNIANRRFDASIFK